MQNSIVFEPIQQPINGRSVHISWQAIHQEVGRQRLLSVTECIEHQFKVTCLSVYAHGQ